MIFEIYGTTAPLALNPKWLLPDRILYPTLLENRVLPNTLPDGTLLSDVPNLDYLNSMFIYPTLGISISLVLSILGLILSLRRKFRPPIIFVAAGIINIVSMVYFVYNVYKNFVLDMPPYLEIRFELGFYLIFLASIMQFISAKTIMETDNWIYNLMLDKLKEIGRIIRGKIIQHKWLISSLPIILIGVGFIFYAIFYEPPTRTNLIIINTQSANQAEVNDNPFNLSQSNNLPIITISIDYKEPTSRGDYLNFNTVCLYIPAENFDNESAKYFDHVSLSLLGLNSVIGNNNVLVNEGGLMREGWMNPRIKRENLINFHPYNTNEYSEPLYSGKFFSEISCKQYKREPLIFTEPNSNEEFEFSYILFYNDINKNRFILSGKANLNFPIRSTNTVEAANIRINRSILLLTGFLIILGSFPFVSSLKQIIQFRKS
ncbi:MAG: hypothetical protein PHU34_08665 [Candidatus Methanoperedens sp.]|nr:hypothetical protein [Candidatus Methanoperedens sp.]